MSLMLANRYFLDRDFARAVPLLEEVLRQDPECSPARKKLIIAYVQLQQMDSALRELLRVLQTQPRLIIDTNAEEEDCPCPELCASLHKRLPYAKDPTPLLLSLGTLEAYCDLERSRHYFREAIRSQPGDDRIPMILEILEREDPSCHGTR